MTQNDILNSIAEQIEDACEAAILKGQQIGREEGRVEGRAEIIKQLLTFGMSVPYTGFDGTVCTFDFSELMNEDAGTVVVECTLAEELVPITAQ